MTNVRTREREGAESRLFCIAHKCASANERRRMRPGSQETDRPPVPSSRKHSALRYEGHNLHRASRERR